MRKTFSFLLLYIGIVCWGSLNCAKFFGGEKEVAVQAKQNVDKNTSILSDIKAKADEIINLCGFASGYNSVVKGQIDTLEKQRAEWETKYETEIKRFFSYRQRHLFWWMVGGLALGVILLLVSGFIPGGGSFAVVGIVFKWMGHIILYICSGGIAAITHFIVWLHARKAVSSESVAKPVSVVSSVFTERKS